MNGRERVLAALALGRPDRVPHLELAYNESSIIKIARHFTGDLPEPDFIQRMDLESKVKLFEAALLVIEELDVDGMTLRVFPRTERVDDMHVRDDWGVTWQLSAHGESVVVGGPIEAESDLDAYTPPKIGEADLLALGYCAQRFKGNRALVLSMQDPFRRSWNLTGGMKRLLLAYYRNPGMAHRLARIVTDYTLEAIDLGISLGADVITLDGDLAHNTGMIMSPAQFRTFIKPYYSEITAFIHQKALPVFKHTDGDHWAIMEDLIEAGFNGIHPIQPQCMDIAEVKRRVGNRICILGNIDCIDTLVNKSPSDVEREVMQTIRVAAPGGGYILTSSNTIHPGVKAENYIAMVKAAHAHGVYGADGAPAA